VASSLTGEARQLTDLRTVKRLLAAAGGMFGAHALAHLKVIPGGNAGFIGILKLGGATVVETWATDKFMPQYAECVLEGGGLLTLLEVIGMVTKGKLGAIPIDTAAAPAATKAMAGSPAAQLTAAGSTYASAAAQPGAPQVASNLNSTIGDDAASSWTNSGV
jgi:hypothetical protein